MTQEEMDAFEGLPAWKRAEIIEEHDENVRQWRAVCQLCRKNLQGTRKQLREHQCERS